MVISSQVSSSQVTVKSLFKIVSSSSKLQSFLIKRDNGFLSCLILFEKFLLIQLIIITADRFQVGFDPSINLRELCEIIDLRERRRKIFLIDVMHLDREKLSQSSATDNSNCMAYQILFT